DLTVITGSASDVDPGVLDKVQLSYKCVSDVCDTKYWNRASGAWDSVAEIFYDADITGNAWEATGASSPTWVTSTSGIDYEIFAKAVDQAQNEVTKPGAPALDSPYIKFTLETPGPISSINTPDTSIPHWRITALPSIAGTALYATTVQVRVTDFGVDLDELGGNDNLCWNGNAWESTTTFNTFVGVNSFAGGNWTFSLSQAQWNGNRRYRVESKAINETPEPDENEVPGVGEKFIIDSSAPVVAITVPAVKYMKALVQLEANVDDEDPGILEEVYFRIKRELTDDYWNWQSSTFTALNSPYTDLTAEIAGTLATYTTDYFSSGQAWETGKTYVARFFAKDKSTNEKWATERTFTIDKSSPTSRILVPFDANDKGIRELSAISGTAEDDYDDSNAAVEVAVRRLTGTPRWYDGSGFSGTGEEPQWQDVNDTVGYLSPKATSWIYAPVGLDDVLVTGYEYLVLSRARDVAVNTQDIFVVDESSFTFKIDKSPPTSSIVYPLDDGDGVNGRYKETEVGQDDINGVPVDNPAVNYAGISASEVRISYLLVNDTYYWFGGEFTNAVSSENAWHSTAIDGTDPWIWEYTGSVVWDGDREYTLEVKSMDDARLADDSGDGNWETYPYISRNFIVDDTPPTVVITSPTELSLDFATNVYGDADDNLAGFNLAEIRISTGTGGSTRYWKEDTSEWVATVETWNDTEKLGSTSWYYEVDNAILEEDIPYKFEAKSLDYAGNYSTVYSTRVFTNERPESFID
ncbi:MAG: hypothetical protein KAI33_08780, partial [Elusimicrobiales bacterium]|nr:hypothetical protein [Elusimicrobiales bacterium]